MLETNYVVLVFGLTCACVAMKAFQSAADYLVDRALEVRAKTSVLIDIPARQKSES
jgi:hypothetical protein